MKKNVGGIDRVLRLVTGLIIMAVAVYYRAWWGVFGLILFLTGAVSRCGLYKLLNDFSTFKEKGAEGAQSAAEVSGDTEGAQATEDKPE